MFWNFGYDFRGVRGDIWRWLCRHLHRQISAHANLDNGCGNTSFLKLYIPLSTCLLLVVKLFCVELQYTLWDFFRTCNLVYIIVSNVGLHKVGTTCPFCLVQNWNFLQKSLILPSRYFFLSSFYSQTMLSMRKLLFSTSVPSIWMFIYVGVSIQY